jgi:hypothetical protein
MLIDKKITLIKYYKNTPTSLSSLSNNLIIAYKVSSNNFLRWSSEEYEVGIPGDFEFLEKGGNYVLIKKDNINFDLDIGTADETAEFVINKLQICIYKGLPLSISFFKDNISNVYKIENNQFLRWNSEENQAGIPVDFDTFFEGEIYLIFSKEPSYILWPPLNFNKGRVTNNNNINWGILEHSEQGVPTI